MQVTPLDIFRIYPNREFLGAIREPIENEQFEQYMPYFEVMEKTNQVGDTLFTFLMRELSDSEASEDIDESVRRVDAAIADLEEVKTRLTCLRGYF